MNKEPSITQTMGLNPPDNFDAREIMEQITKSILEKELERAPQFEEPIIFSIAVPDPCRSKEAVDIINKAVGEYTIKNPINGEVLGRITTIIDHIQLTARHIPTI